MIFSGVQRVIRVVYPPLPPSDKVPLYTTEEVHLFNLSFIYIKKILGWNTGGPGPGAHRRNPKMQRKD